MWRCFLVSQERLLEPLQLRRVREEARRLKKEKGIKISHAYHLIALSRGFKSWTSLLTFYGAIK